MRQRSRLVTRLGKVTVREYSDGTYRIRWRVDGTQNERTATTEAEAKEIALNLFTNDVDTPPDSVRQFGELCVVANSERYRPQGWGTARVQKKQGFARNHIIPHLGQLECRQVTPQVVNAWLRDRKDSGLARATVVELRVEVCRIIRLGIVLGTFRPDYHFAAIEVPALARDGSEQHKVFIPTEAAVDLLVEALKAFDSPDVGFYPSAIAQTARMAGLRWGEILAITGPESAGYTRHEGNTWSSDGILAVDWQLNEQDPHNLKVLPKLNKQREVFMPPGLVELLERIVAEDEQRREEHPTAPRSRVSVPYLFRGKHGGVLRRNNWSGRIWQPAIAATPDNWPSGVGIHSLRHRWVSSSLESGLAVVDVAALAGHSDPSFTMRVYAHSDADRMKRAAAVLGSGTATQPPPANSTNGEIGALKAMLAQQAALMEKMLAS